MKWFSRKNTERVVAQASTAFHIVTLPKSGTHLLSNIFAKLPVQMHITHCIDIEGAEILPPGTQQIINIRDPRDIFVSLRDWSVKRCRQGVEQGITFPAYQDIATFQPWLDKSPDEQLEILLSESKDMPYLIWALRKNFTYVSDNKDKKHTRITRFEDIIGCSGVGINDTQCQEIYNICQFFGTDISMEQVHEATSSAWGNSATFNNPSAEKWRRTFTDKHLRLFNERWGDFATDWGYRTATESDLISS